MEKKIRFTETEMKVLKVLEGTEGKSFTLAELSSMVGMELKAGHIMALVRTKGKLVKGEDATVPCVSKRKVSTYGLMEGCGSIDELKPTQKSIMEALMEKGVGAFFTLEEIGAMVGKKLTAGHITALLHTYVEKGEDRIVESESTKKVSTYKLA